MRGFTLLEMIVAMGIAGLVFAVIFSIFIYNSRMYTMANNQAGILRESTEILEIVGILVRESADVRLEEGAVEGITKYEFLAPTFPQPDSEASLQPFAWVIFNSNERNLHIESEHGTRQYQHIEWFEIANSSSSAENRLKEIIVIGTRDTETRQFKATASMRN